MILANALREYRFKFYLNASHYVIFNNKKGQVHPHTWEFQVDILIDRSKYMEFNDFERGINAFIDPYQDQVMNEVEPFDLIIPTLESMLDYFAPKIRDIIGKLGGQVIRVEGSETPTRSYIHDFSQQISDEELIQNASGVAEYPYEDTVIYDYYGIPYMDDYIMMGNYPMQSNIPVQSNVPMQSNIPMQSNVPVQSNVPIQSNVPVQSNVPMQSNIPMQSNVPVQNSFPVQGSYPMQDNYYPQNNIPYESFHAASYMEQKGYSGDSGSTGHNNSMNDIFDKIIQDGIGS